MAETDPHTGAPVGKALRAHARLPALEEMLPFLFPEADDDAVLQHAGGWLRDASLLVEIGPGGRRAAIARGSRLLLAPLTPTGASSAISNVVSTLKPS